MSSPAFNHLPRKAYRMRLMAVLLLPLLWVALIGVGIAAFSSANPLPPARSIGRSWNPFAAPTSFYSIYFREWGSGPEGCVTGNMQSDFQRGRCTEFLSRMAKASLIALAPVAALWIAYVLGMDSLRITYRRVRKRIEARKAVAKGVVTNPAMAANDFYGWYYGFRSISVEVGRGVQYRVYFPQEGQLPLPGDPVAIFSVGSALGQPRYFGIYYAPHVAVIAGENES